MRKLLLLLLPFCMGAIGAHAQPTTVLLPQQTFNSLAGWTVDFGGQIATNGDSPSTGYPTASGGNNLRFNNCPIFGSNPGNFYAIRTPPINTTGYAGLELLFGKRRSEGWTAIMTLAYSINGGATWNVLATEVAAATSWSDDSYTLPTETENQPSLLIRWGFMTLAGDGTGNCTDPPNFRIDDVQVISTMLAIEVSIFTARPVGNSVRLDWRTEGERNNDYMEVEHSTDGRQYRKIGTVQGAGTTLEGQAYSFRHDTPAAGLNYYRLRQVDYDGGYAYHGPVSARMKGDQGGKLSLFPTVASDVVQVQYEGQLSSEAELQIIGMDGRVWRQQRWEVKSASLSVPVQDLPDGMYLLRLQLGREVEVARFVKQ